MLPRIASLLVLLCCATWANAAPTGVVREWPTSADYQRTPSALIRGDVTVRAANAPFGPLLTEVARRSNYSITFAPGVDTSRRVTVDFNRAEAEDVFRATPGLAGYVAVFDHYRRTVHVTDSATWHFRLPSNMPEARAGVGTAALLTRLKELAGPTSQVNIEDSGRVSVRADGYGLKRVHEHLRQAAANAAFEPLIGEAP